MNVAPIVLFVYNRPKHTKTTIEALLKNDLAKESILYIFADGPKVNASEIALKNISDLRKYIHTIKGFKNVIIEESNINKGLAKSIVYGVTKIVEKHGRIVVLEDDVVTSSHFLHYINQSLDIYEEEDDVICINGASFFNERHIPEATYFQYGADCQGWATWHRGWKLFNDDGKNLLKTIMSNQKLKNQLTYNSTYDYINMLKGTIEGRIDSWAIKWLCSAIVNKKLCLYPSKSLVHNIGFDSEATNTKGNSTAYELEYISIVADETTVHFPKIRIEENITMRKILEDKYRRLIPKENLINRIFKKIKNILFQCVNY